MPRRKNPGTTFVMFLVLVAAGWAAYKYLYVDRVFDTKVVEGPAEGKEQQIRAAIVEAFSDDPCFNEVSNMGWRGQEFRWRVDVNIPDTCRDQARTFAKRVADVVRSASGGADANVFVYAVGQEVARYVP